ncbi:PREDICTED: sex peptide receptor-like, partial [Rhagoletis zephyria]|uniref:sex peptide receptor-like n=1 Tax=Rhagoletis zephyria TaxID=28612 RepID=UPI0008112348
MSDATNFSMPEVDHVKEFLLNESYLLNCSHPDIFNVTQAAPIQYASVMYGGIMPILVAVTLLANSLIIAVLTRRHMKTPTNLVLLWMAIADLLTLLSPAPWYFYMYTMGYHSVLLNGSFLCYVYNVMTEHVPILLHNSSIWLTILLAAQRYIYICHPTLAKTLCTIPKVNRAVVTIFIASISVQASRFFDTQYESVTCADDQNMATTACLQKVSSWVTRPEIYFPLYFGFRIVFVNLGPCIALVILNVLLFSALQRAQKTRLKLLQDGNASSRKKRNDLSNSTTYMLIVVVSVFLCVEIPMAIATIIHLLVNMEIITFEGDSHRPFTQITVLLVNFIIMLSFPLNFAIYCGMSAQFRNTFKALFVGRLFNQRLNGSQSQAVPPDCNT